MLPITTFGFATTGSNYKLSKFVLPDFRISEYWIAVGMHGSALSVSLWSNP